MSKLKKIIFLLFSIFLITKTYSQDSLSLNASYKKNYKNEFRTSFVGLFNNIVFVGYERFFKNRTSLVFNAEAKYLKDDNNYNAGYQGELQFRFYYFTKYKNDYAVKLNGLYVATYGIYGYTEYQKGCSGWYVYPCVAAEIENKPIAGGGILAGLKFTIENKMSIDFNLGGGVRYNYLNNNNYYDNSDYNGIKIKSNVTFGFKF